MTKQEVRSYRKGHRRPPIEVKYTLFFSPKGELINVYNQYGSQISKDSECFQHFKDKYKNFKP